MPKKKFNALHLFADMIDECDDLMTLTFILITIHSMTDALLTQLMEILDDEIGGMNDDEE